MTSPMRIQGVHHVARVTTRPDESTAFYRDVLGFREIPRPPFDFRGAWLFAYGIQIHIIENREQIPDPERPIDTRGNHLAFQIENAEHAKQQLQARGIDYIEMVNAGGVHQLFFRDPDGHVIEFAANYAPVPGRTDVESA